MSGARAPSLTGNYMYNARRNDQYIFRVSPLWLDYIKKIRLIGEVKNTGSDIVYLTNRYDRAAELSYLSSRGDGAFMVYRKAMQFSRRYNSTAAYFDSSFYADNRHLSRAMNFMKFHTSKGKVYFIANNYPTEKRFLDEIVAAQLCAFSTSDTDSLYTQEYFFGLHGNNRSPTTLAFILKLLESRGQPRRAAVMRASGADLYNAVKRRGTYFVNTKLQYKDLTRLYIGPVPCKDPFSTHWRKVIPGLFKVGQ